MSLINATYLLGLIGLIIPIIIHLWSRKEGKIIKVGSTRFMPVAETSQSSSIKLNELLLLFLRLLLIALLVLLMAGMAIHSEKESTSGIVLIDPALKNDYRVKRALDTIQYEKKYLAKGFPAFEQNKVPPSLDNYWSTFNELTLLNADTIVIISDLSVRKFGGKRPVSNKVIQWVSIDSEEEKSASFMKLTKDDKSLIIKGKYTQEKTTYELLESNAEVSDVTEDWDTLSFAIYSTKEFEMEGLFFKSALNVISESSHRPFSIRRIENSNTLYDADWLIWLSTEVPPTINGNRIVFKANDFDELFRRSTTNNYELTKRLEMSNLWSDDFIGQLMSLIIPVKKDSSEMLQLAVEMVKPARSIARSSAVNSYKTALMFPWVLFVLLFVLERYYSYQRKL